jgi:chromosome segregation ATPase
MDDQATPHTYQQAAEALGIEAEAVRARLRRGALRRGPLTNDRRPTVLLSPDEIATIRASIRTQAPESELDSAPDSAVRPDESRTIKALEGEVETLRDALGRERERADKAEGESVTLREQAAAERARAVQAERERGAAKVAAASAEGEARGLRLALEEARRPFWRRWFG